MRPVERNQLWVVGDHSVGTFDILSPEFHRWVNGMSDDPPAVIYTDPPWVEATVKLAYKAIGKNIFPPQRELVDCCCDIAAQFAIPLYIETSAVNSLLGDAKARVRNAHGTVCGTIDLTYGAKARCNLVYATWGNAVHNIPKHIKGMDDNLVPNSLFAHYIAKGELFEEDIVLDPMCGSGGATLIGALNNGLCFIGNDLVPEKAAKTIAMLENHTGLQAYRVGVP